MAAQIISRTEWQRLLARSRNLQAEADQAKSEGRYWEADKLWQIIAPRNRKIRSSELKVRGIDC